MKKKIIAIAVLTGLFFTACNNQPKTESKEEEKMTNTSEYSIIGKKGKITFPEMTAEVNYTSDTSLHWKTTDSKGIVAEGSEKINYQKLTNNLYFFNWIEKDGFTVSQIIDTKNGTVKAFWSFNDERSDRGKRSEMFVDAKFEFVNKINEK
ncbi:MoaF-related domain-containing protein [Pedobacter sp. N23S346]|uniref:MoaF-related domain-containing protein n=1 Tax=Pedobacter sp. N23S346 TaxID=3402750 RepID=UPI003AC0D4D5